MQLGEDVFWNFRVALYLWAKGKKPCLLGLSEVDVTDWITLVLYICCWGSDTVYTAFVDPSMVGHIGLDNPEQKSSQRTGKRLLKTLAAPEMLPLLDHWNTQTKKVSLREIMSEEIALQEKHNLVWVSINIKPLSLTLGWLCVFTLWFLFDSVS